ncbi:MAG: serine/threonine protein kinase [Bryobacterales bacterium]|nr:serine/threonine protein kinase [Bryobacterales bacterium]MBV9399058.1 serine/threonine protein kinase [Bryobacterales bacterium]
MMVRKRFDQYEIVRKLGRSMTDVYLARDTETDRRVVLKLVEQSGDQFTQIVIEAERRGAEIQKQLHDADPRILEVYEFGERNGCFFVAMEHCEGRSIAEILEVERRLDPQRAARYAVEVLSQLDRLHSFVTDLDGRNRAVVHGDIKPSNIQIAAGDQVRLLDFGIAKAITNTHHLTHHNLGSPTYCSPERLEKAQVEPQADLWAVGVSLYEMIAGSLPYQAATTRKLEVLIESRRPPRALPADCPGPLRAIIQKSLGARVERRYASAADFADDLRTFLNGCPTRAEKEIPAWESPETVQQARPAQQGRGFRFPSLSSNTTGALRALAAGVVIGLLLVIPMHYLLGFERSMQPLRESRDYSRLSAADIAADWNVYQKLKRDGVFLGRFSPAPGLAQAFRQRLISAADSVVEKYRNSSDPALANFEWSKAQLALTHAVEIDGADRESRGKLALCEGYLNLIRNPQLPKAEQSETSFQVAAADLPRSPDPHLALAYLYTYVFHNAGKAMGEFAEAERRGFESGPREFEQQGDAYLFRAEYELRQAQRLVGSSRVESSRWVRQTNNDLDRARDLYEPIAGFSNVNVGIERIYRDRGEAEQLAEALAKPQRKPPAAARTRPPSAPRRLQSPPQQKYTDPKNPQPPALESKNPPYVEDPAYDY